MASRRSICGGEGRLRQVLAVLAFVACVLGPGVGSVAAQPADLAELVEKLDHARFGQREAAGQRIYQIQGISLDEIEAQAARDDISPEQRLRLDRVGRRIFAASPHGGLGIRFAREIPGVGVQIAGTVQNERFPASKLLQADDVIVAVDGRDLVSQSWFSLWIISHQPGDVLALTVRREGNLIEIEAPLGDYADLGNGPAPNSRTLDAAYDVRREQNATLGPSIAIAAADLLDAAYRGQLDRTTRPTSVSSSISIGGRSDSLASAEDHVARSLDSIHSISLTGSSIPSVLPLDLREELSRTFIRQRDSALRRAAQLESIAEGRADQVEVEGLLRQAEAARRMASEIEDRLTELQLAPERSPAE